MSSWGNFGEKIQRDQKKKKIPTATFKVVVIQLLSQIDNLGLTLCDPMDFSTPGSSVLDHLSQSQLKSMSIESVMLSISFGAIPFSCLQSSPASGSFPTSWLFASGGQNIGSSASASVLPMNILDWFLLGLTSFRIDWFDLLADPKWNLLPPWYPGPRFSMVAYGRGVGGRVWV